MADLNHKELLRRRDLGRSVRERYENDWKLNLSYLNGNQHLVYTQGQGITKRVYPEGFPVVTRNMMTKLHQINLARMLRTKPTATVLPLSDDQRDVVLANDASAWLAQTDREDDNDARVRDLVDWQLATGNGILKTFWNRVENRPCTVVVPPFEVVFDPYATALSKIRWVVHTQFLDPDMARTLYPGAGSLLKTTRRGTEELVNADMFTGGVGTRDEAEGVIVHEYWEKPWAGRPNGALVVFSDSGVLSAQEFPYRHKTLPFTHAGHIKRTNAIWCRSHNDSIRGLQDEVNRVEGQIIENRGLSHGKWWIDSMVQLEEDPNSDPRQILKGASGVPGVRPELIPGIPVDSKLMGEPDRYSWAMADVSGVHEVSSGGVPGRVEAASAIQLLQETDDSVMQDARHNLDQCIEEAARQRLMLLKQFSPGEIDVKVYDRHGRFSRRKFKPAKLKLEQRVVVKSTSGLPQSIAGRRDTVMQLWQAGILTDSRQVLELLQIGPDEVDFLSDQADRTKAVRENETLRNVTEEDLSRTTDDGQPIPVMERPSKYDNHDVHLQLHAQFEKTEEFEALPLEVREHLHFHMAEHEEYQKYLLGQEALKQQILQGMAPPPEDPDIAAEPDVTQQPQQMPPQGGAPPPVVPPQPAPGVAAPQSPDLQQPNQQQAPSAPSAPSAPPLAPGGAN